MTKFLFTVASFLLTQSAFAISTWDARVYESNADGKAYTYVLLSNETSANLLYCDASWTSKAFAACKVLFGTNHSEIKATLVVSKVASVVSFHFSGVKPNSSSQPGVAVTELKSFLTIASVDLADDAYLLLTGTAIDSGRGIPRTESMRASLHKTSQFTTQEQAFGLLAFDLER